MTIKKYGHGDGRILKDDKKQAAKTEWTEKDQEELLAEQSDAMGDGEDSD